MENPISWSVLEYHEKNHTTDWYWTVGLITLVILVACVFFKNYFLGVLLLLGIGTLTYLTIRKPETVTVTLQEKGIQIRTELFLYRNLKAFWIEEEEQANSDRHLLILTKRLYSPLIALPLGDVAPETIRQALLAHIPEQEMRENISHKFLEVLGF
jgi:hypothetical protein